MANGRITSNKWWLIMGIVMGFLFIVFWGLEFYKGIHAWKLQLAVLLMIWIWLFVCVICVKWCINLLKKKKIKKNKENPAMIIW